MLSTHRLLRAALAALLCSCAALSCAPIPPATSSRPKAEAPKDSSPAQAPREQTPQSSAPQGPPVATAPIVIPAPVPAKPATGPAIALLLPLDAPEFQPAAEALREGFLAGTAVEGKKPDIVIRRSDASDDRVIAAYQAAVEAGTRVIVGPMTRSAVTALVRNGHVAVPTIALNQPDGGLPAPHLLYVFSLSAETEARHIARQAWADTMRIAGVVNAATPIDRRTRDAFIDEWLLLGGRITKVLEAGSGADPALLRETLDQDPPHFVFLAAGGERARWLRPFLGGQMPVYATSQVNTTDDTLKNLDLNGVRLAEMPWLLRPQDPVVSRYPRPAIEGDMARFYALGIDASRIAAKLLDGQHAFAFDGVTGAISVSATGVVDRRPIAATFRDGKCVALE